MSLAAKLAQSVRYVFSRNNYCLLFLLFQIGLRESIPNQASTHNHRHEHIQIVTALDGTWGRSWWKSGETCFGRLRLPTFLMYDTVSEGLHDSYLTISQSLALGRPPSIHFSYVDCEYPNDDEATLNNDGNIEYGCKFCFSFKGSKL